MSSTSSSVDVIWNAADPLTNFPNENCLPVIGSCQVSSILSTLENIPSEKAREPTRVLDTFKSIPINVIDSDAVGSDRLNHKKKLKEGVKQLYQEMVYFGCNFCPFICTKDSKISDHIDSVHKNQENSVRPPLKCPGCANVFYHKQSLRSHLIHDHEVARSDITKIVNGVVYVSVLAGDKKMTPLDILNVEVGGAPDEASKPEPAAAPEPEPEPAVEPEPEPALDPEPETTAEPGVAPQLHVLQDELKRSAAHKCCVPSCAVRMRDVVNMAYHVKCHCGKAFRCLECGAGFVVWKTLQTHLWREHAVDMEMHACDQCDYRTYNLAELNNVHRLIHGADKPFLCDQCSKGFKNPKQLRNHKAVHRARPADPAQRCHVCGRTFADKRHLKVHMAGVHLKLKPFSCNFCGYKGASNGALKLHIRQHTGEKPFSCDSCDYSTSDHNSLRRHKSRHSGVKKYKCAHCEYACIQSSTFKTHLKTKHPGLENELMFSCRLCQFRSISKDKYLVHVASHKEKRRRAPDPLSPPPSDKRLDAKPDFLHEDIRLEDVPVALISKVDDGCIILPVQDAEILNLAQPLADDALSATAAISNGLQYLYNASSIVLEVAPDKKP